MSQKTLTRASKALLARPVFANIATVQDDGTPHLTPVWIDIDGDNIVINTADGRAKARNMRTSSKVAISVLDPDNPYQAISLQGTVTEITEDGADAHVDFLAKKYLGVDSYPMRQPDEHRLKITIHPDKILMQPSDT